MYIPALQPQVDSSGAGGGLIGLLRLLVSADGSEMNSQKVKESFPVNLSFVKLGFRFRR